MTQDEYAEIDLAALSDDELVEQMHNDLYDGMKDEIVEGTNILLGRGFSATQVLDDALVAGMKIVGIDFRDGILFVPEVLLAANAMKAGMAILRPLLAETGAEPVGKVVIGTVKGDIHDIGKNLVGMMLEGAGFEVFDLGINTDADKFIAALDQHKPDILGHVGAADDDHAVHEGRHPDAQGSRHARRLHRARRRRAAQRGVRHGGRRRCLLPRRRRGRRDGPAPHRRTPCPRRLTDRRRLRRPARQCRRASSSIGCGALARELRRADPRTCPDVDVDLPAGHAAQPRPARIPDAVRDRIRRRARLAGHDRIFVAYADCGTGGMLDVVLERRGRRAARRRPLLRVLRGLGGLRGRLRTRSSATFYLTDFLARHFDRLVIVGLGLDRHPELLADYFGNYRRLVYLAQTDDPALTAKARGRRRPPRASPSSAARRATAS